jgi:LuxR family maltose regulon positive regulatory protein
MAAGDVGAVAGLMRNLWFPVYRQGRMTTLYRWFRWLDDRDGLEAHPAIAAQAALVAAQTGHPAEAERLADTVDRWQYGDPSRPDDPVAEAWAAVVRAILCRHGVRQMRADADEAAQKLAAAGIVAASAALCQGIARILSGDPEDGDACLETAVSVAGQIGAPETLGMALCEQALLAMARDDWSRAGRLAEQVGTALRHTGTEILLACAVRARVAMHREDVAAARRELISAQRLRPLMTYARPHMAVQARIELAHVQLALSDLAGARTLMREIDEILGRRPDLGTLVGEAQALRARLSGERIPSAPGASSLTAAELRVLPMLATHLSFPEIGAEMFLSPHTVKSQAMAIYRKLGASSRHQAVTRSRELGLLEG